MYTKALVLAAASHFEHEVCSAIRRFAAKHDCAARLIELFIEKQALSRKYHTLFNWEQTNANSFFGLFGDGFSSHMKSLVRSDPTLKAAVEAFLDIGRERNRMVHGDFASYTLDKTAAEIFTNFQSALYFVDQISAQLDNHGATASQPTTDE